MITLHHAQGTAMSADVHEIHFENFKALMTYFKSLTEIDDRQTVYLLTERDPDFDYSQGSRTHLLISESIFHINRYLREIIFFVDKSEDHIVFLQEYKSYEDAYSVALSMRENSFLCYKD
jgi:hypothetical protein